ncbi:MAG TPA: hypothetical protein VFP55_00575 [Solirubrobacteraceae bacterium]|nr:hypothetical protein [Solirubrobacteraceae bacterium]
MSDPSDHEFPPELEGIAARLREERAVADPLALDQIKGRVIRRVHSRGTRAGGMKARLATVFTLLALVGGTGGALAVAGSGGGGGSGASAAASQYRPPCRIGGHYFKHCPPRFPHHFHCYIGNHYYKNCPYGHVKGVHAVKHKRHKRTKPAFTG